MNHSATIGGIRELSASSTLRCNRGWIRLCSHCCRGYHFIFIVHWM